MTHATALTAAHAAVTDAYVEGLLAPLREELGALRDAHAATLAELTTARGDDTTDEATIADLRARATAAEARVAELEQALAARPTPGSTAPAAPSLTAPGYSLVHHEDFAAGMGAWDPWSSPPLKNTAAATDERVPTKAEHHRVVDDPTATGGKALSMLTAVADYPLPDGKTGRGWVTSRGGLQGADVKGPFRLEFRYRVTAPSLGVGYAVMWWPAGGGWPWEVDAAEDFGGDAQGRRLRICVRHHYDRNNDGQAKEQDFYDVDLDAFVYRTVAVEWDGARLRQWIDGVKVADYALTKLSFDGTRETGFFTIGKKQPGAVKGGPITEDELFLDYVTVWRKVA